MPDRLGHHADHGSVVVEAFGRREVVVTVTREQEVLHRGVVLPWTGLVI